jgi:response regulator RpfG family c-di-GMP phosphodiesterase
MIYQLNLREVTYALSEALDYVGIDDIMHGKRVACIACEIAKKLGWRQSKLDKVMLMAMLHDCGVSSTGVHHAIVSQLDWEDAYVHCAIGASLLHDVPFYDGFAEIIAFHHTHWEAFEFQIDEEMKLYANLIYLSDRIDALRSQFGAHLSHEKETIRTIIQTHSPSMFAPKLCEAFVEISHRDSFWYYLDSFALPYYFKDWIDQGEIQAIHFDELKKIAMMFAGIVNAKISYDAQHTVRLASLARFIARLYNLSLRDQETVELCALLYDLGKLRVPDVLVTKTAPLSDEEHIRIRRQGFDAQIILGQIKGFEKIAKTVSLYHEAQNAKEKGIVDDETSKPLEVRILTFAHTIDALMPLQKSEMVETLEAVISEHQLDPIIVPYIATYLDSYHPYLASNSLHVKDFDA